MEPLPATEVLTLDPRIKSHCEFLTTLQLVLITNYFVLSMSVIGYL